MASRITSLVVYPIKSCGGIERSELVVAPGGVEDDRLYMITELSGEFVTARTEPRLLLVRLRDTPSGFLATFPDGSGLALPRKLGAENELRRVTVWRDEVLALEFSEGSRAFSSYLGRSVRLVFVPEANRRAVDPKRANPGDRVGFADGYPLLLLSETSLEELNVRLRAAGESPITMARFRPNVVLDGSAPHEEDALTRFSLGEIAFEMPKLCDRCVMTTINPLTGEPGKEPLRTLASYRRSEGKVWFGANIIPRGSGTLRLNMPLSA